MAPAKRWLTSNSIRHQAKVHTAKSLVGVATHLNHDEGVFVLEKVARAPSRRQLSSLVS
jgi:hypothetical protein